MLREISYKMLWHFAWKLGYSIQEIEKPPLKTYGQDIRELPYLSDLPYTTVNLPTALGIGLNFFPLQDNKIYHPFVLALLTAGFENQEEHILELLKKYRDLVTLKTPNDMFGFDADEKIFPIHDHPYSFTYPWSPLGPREVREKKLAYHSNENKRFGFKSQESLDLSGTSDEKVRIETSRLLEVYHQIKTRGFKPQYPDSLGCYVLKQEEDYKWFVQGGQHRAAVLAALGFDKIPVHVRQIIRREEAAFWPNVLSGLYSEKKALTIFDAMFHAEIPPVAQAWIDYVDQSYHDLTYTC